MFEHAFDFAVLAFAQRHRQPAVGALHAIEGRPNARVMHAIQRQTFAEPIENGLIGDAVGADPVTPDPAGRRQFEDAREAAVIGEQQKSFGIDVEPADADDARAVWPMLAQKIKNRRPALGITLGRDETARLMEQKEPRAGALDERLAVDGDVITRLDVDSRIRERDAVQATRPSPIQLSASRREQSPARAMTLAMRDPDSAASAGAIWAALGLVSWALRGAGLRLNGGGGAARTRLRELRLAGLRFRGFFDVLRAAPCAT